MDCCHTALTVGPALQDTIAYLASIVLNRSNRSWSYSPHGSGLPLDIPLPISFAVPLLTVFDTFLRCLDSIRCSQWYPVTMECLPYNAEQSKVEPWTCRGLVSAQH